MQSGQARLSPDADGIWPAAAKSYIRTARIWPTTPTSSARDGGSRLAVLADGEARLRELEELLGLVEEYLRDLPELMGPEIRVREYEAVPAERTPDNPHGVYTLTPDRIRHLTGGELADKRLAAEAARGARCRELYARLGLRAAVRAGGTVEITIGATNTKGVMRWDEPSSPSTTSMRT